MKIGNLALIAVVGMAVAACETQPDRFEAGEWEIQSWMTSDALGAQRAEPQVFRQTLSTQKAAFPAEHVLFGEFYRGDSPQQITFENGRIEGYLEKQAVAPFPAHRQSVSGTYTSDEFRIEVTLPPLTPGLRQVVEGRLVERTD